MSVCEPMEVVSVSLTFSLPEAEAHLAEAEREAQELAERVEALRMVTEGLRRLNGHAAELFPSVRTLADTPLGGGGSENLNAHPVGREAVRLIVSERPGLWRLRDIVAEATSRGWATDRKPIEVAAHRLCGDGAMRRVRPGLYMFPADFDEEAMTP
jgi:hypothetical protein